jgi:hypothetical protein
MPFGTSGPTSNNPTWQMVRNTFLGPRIVTYDLVNDCKAVLYAWYKRGLPGSKPPVAMGVCQTAIASAIPLMRWLMSLNVHRFDQVKPIHVANYVHHIKTRLVRNAHSVYDSLRILDFLWVFRDETSFPLADCPWGTSSLWRVSGLGKQAGRNEVGKTPIIPPMSSPGLQLLRTDSCERARHLNQRDAGRLGLRNPALIVHPRCGTVCPVDHQRHAQ